MTQFDIHYYHTVALIQYQIGVKASLIMHKDNNFQHISLMVVKTSPLIRTGLIVTPSRTSDKSWIHMDLSSKTVTGEPRQAALRQKKNPEYFYPSCKERSVYGGQLYPIRCSSGTETCWPGPMFDAYTMNSNMYAATGHWHLQILQTVCSWACWPGI